MRTIPIKCDPRPYLAACAHVTLLHREQKFATYIDHALVDVDIQVAPLVTGAAQQGGEEEQEA